MMTLRAPASAGIEGLRRAELEGRIALALVDVGDEDRLVRQRARKLQAHHADAAEPDDEKRAELQIGHRLLDGAIAGEAGAHERAGDGRRDALHVEQIARMRHQHVRGVAAVDGDAERAGRVAHVLVAALAQPALAAADPGVGGVELALRHA